MSFPLFDGPCLLRDAMPLAWDSSAEPASDWEMSRYLQVLAEFEQPSELLDEKYNTQNAKLDLNLLWLARSLNTQTLGETRVTLGLEYVAWQSPQAQTLEQKGMVLFCLSQQFPLLLKFPAQITQCTPMDDGYCVQASWLPMSEGLLDSFEKTIFRYHRRHIHQLRERSE